MKSAKIDKWAKIKYNKSGWNSLSACSVWRQKNGIKD